MSPGAGRGAPADGALARLLALKPGEAGRVLPAAAYHLSFVAGVVALKSAAAALVVARFDASVLPVLYIVAALATGLVAVGDGVLRRKIGPPRRSLLVAAAATLGLVGAASVGSRPAVAVLYVFAEVWATVTSVRFWAALGESFDARESKRLFGVVGGFGMAGSILSGLAVGALGMRVGAVAIAALAAVTMVLCAALGRVMVRRAGADGRARAEPAAGGGERRGLGQALAALGAFRKDPYPRSLAWLAGLFAVLTVTVDFLFRVSAQGALSEAELASLFGTTNLALGVAAMLFQLLMTGRVLARFGIFRFLSIIPVGTAALAAVCAGFPTLWPAFALKVVEGVGSFSVHPTGMQLLYGPLPDAARVPARAFVDGLVKKGGAAVGGLTLLALGPFVGHVGLAATIAVVSVLAVGLLAEVKRLYVKTIDQRLAGARWQEAIALDAEARAVLLKALTEPDPARALLAADLLLGDRTADFGPWVRALLAHPSERVRARGVKLAVEMRLTELVPRLRVVATSDERRPRDEAVFALAQLDAEAEAILAPLLSSADPGQRGSAVAALVRLELERGVADGPAARALEAWLARSDATPAERRELARLLGRLKGTRYTRRVDRLLDDPDASVRRMAVASVGECERIDLAPRLVELLGERPMRRAAREALASMGDRVADLLEDALNDKARPAPVRYELPRLLRYVGSPRAARALLFSNIEDDPFLRYRIALALTRMRMADETLTFDPARVREAVVRRVQAYLYYLPVYRDLCRALPPGAILLRALEDRLDQSLEIVFRLLGLVHPHRSIMNVFHRFAGADAHGRAYALELFDNLVAEGMRGRVLPLLERYHRLPLEEGEVERAPARLLELVVSKDAVLRGCAIATARRLAPGVAVLPIPEEGTVSERVMEKVFLLEGVEIFGRCSVDDLAALAAIARERRFEAGSYVFRERDPADALYVIIEGRVRVETQGKLLVEFKEKEGFGEASLLDGAPRPADAVAVTEVRALAIERQDFLDLVSDRPELLKGLFAALTRSLRSVIEVAAGAKAEKP